MAESNVWLWKEPDCRWKEDVTKLINGTNYIDKGEIPQFLCSLCFIYISVKLY